MINFRCVICFLVIFMVKLGNDTFVMKPKDKIN